MAEIVDGKKIADGILSGLRTELSKLKTAGITPRLVVILVGKNPASLSYIRVKQKRAREVGLRVEVQAYPENTPQAALQKAIQEFNKQPDVCGILVQLPLPGHLDKQAVLDSIRPELDVDCLTSGNKQKLFRGEEVPFLPPAVAAVLKILEVSEVNLAEANVLIVGSGDLIGKPLAALLLNRKISFKLANRYTENLPELAQKADVIIAGAGKPGLITGERVKKGAVVIDAGSTGSEKGEVVGDVDFESVVKKARLLAPVPGGVGPVTVAMLLGNVVRSAQRKLA